MVFISLYLVGLFATASKALADDHLNDPGAAGEGRLIGFIRPSP
jgi:hypothetical protein